MTIVFLLIGLLPATAIGWLLLRLIEKNATVLLPIERVSLGFLLGSVLTMFCSFVLQVTVALPFTLVGFGIVQLVLLGILIALTYPWTTLWPTSHPPLPTQKVSRIAWAILSLLLGLTALKILFTGSIFLFAAPSFLDDTLDNWNLRGKVFYYTEELTIDLPTPFDGGNQNLGISSYPPTVPMLKAWLSTIQGQWSEPLINGLHITWYITSFSLLFSFLRRKLSLFWSCVGVYILGSIPLFLMHGTNAYADMFLSVHLFAVLYPLYLALDTNNTSSCTVFLRISAVMAALIPFTKNEGFALYLPGIAAVACLTFFLLWKKRQLNLRQIVQNIAWFAIPLLLIAGPWLLFKNLNGMAFGNAKPITSMGFLYNHAVWLAVLVNTFFEGNWLLLFPVFFLLIIWQWKRAFFSPLVTFVSFFLLLYFTQLGLYLFTGLATEAIRQTGYARGLIHMTLPVVATVTLLCAHIFARQENRS